MKGKIASTDGKEIVICRRGVCIFVSIKLVKLLQGEEIQFELALPGFLMARLVDLAIVLCPLEIRLLVDDFHGRIPFGWPGIISKFGVDCSY